MIKTIMSVALLSTLTLTGINVNIDLDFLKPNEVEEISQKEFEEEVIKSEEIVLVDFYANWCKPCKDLSPRLDEVAKSERNIKFIKIDIDHATDLKVEYEIKAVPTMIIYKDGKEIDRHMGPLEVDEIIEWLKGIS